MGLGCNGQQLQHSFTASLERVHSPAPLTSDLFILGGGDFGVFRSCLPGTLISLLLLTLTPWCLLSLAHFLFQGYYFSGFQVPLML